MEKLFVNYSKSKQDFINSGLQEIYANKIVFIGNGECIFTKGKFFANEQELIALISNLVEQERQARIEVANTKVDKVEGKLLSLEDFTTFFKNKLDGLNNYDDTELSNKINSLRNDLDTLVKGDTSEAIETFNEIIAFLEEIEDKENLLSLLVTIESKIPTLLSLLQEDTEHRLVTDAEKAIWNHSYLPLSGGKLTGNLHIGKDAVGNTDNRYLYLWKGDGTNSHRGLFAITNDGVLLNYWSPTTGAYSNLALTADDIYFNKYNGELKKVWHEDNDGHESGLDADTIDGVHSSDLFVSPDYWQSLGDFNDIDQQGFYAISGANVSNCPVKFGNLILFYNSHSPTYSNAQIVIDAEKHHMQFRHRWDNKWDKWRQIATTDSNVASATKLATPIKLWGADIDGTQNYGGSLTLMSNTAINGTTEDGKVEHCLIPRWSDGKTYFNFGSTGLVVRNNNSDIKMVISPDGNMGIGTTNPQYKLEVLSGMDNVMCISSSISSNEASIKYIGKDGKAWSVGKGVGASLDGFGFWSNTLLDNVMTLKSNGTVGIGTTNPQRKLDVNGSAYFNDGIYIPNNTGIYAKDSNGESINFTHLNTNNVLSFGYATMMKGYDTSLCGNRIIFASGDSVGGMMLNQHGNVTIGGSDLANTNVKLYVDGGTVANDYISCKNIMARSGESTFAYSGYSDPAPGKNAAIKISGNLYQGNGEVSFNGQITSGDLVDWYGVSWSENSSDPTCTRIGNMALHRSLPILSAMQGYLIGNTISSITDGIIPLNDDWSRTKYGFINNVQTEPLYAGNIMVKIPEFWYIDDYEPSTKTHNLKISQTAKAGWCHHKEAYVGAYEGYNDNNFYRSKKNVIPTVSVSRETLRPLARANGYEDEYKWNIYTYEEHRAICHLFLVEYATRNSQAEVNTALTADGFKQGGLGSGCTTGVVKINGVDTYSFIPTGTTDSLGNGSGQVAYTVMLTDADGNEIGTVTRYANRYRGIENPFGHIWKHVDDIINIYDGSNYKTVYKCNKPEHFATNKNAKYKPLCSFPGGSKMKGWSEEIKATINCDFFKYSVGGSESTYWCDYNYDNDDTSEHCLIIGGDSSNGGAAGLFCFHLAYGVGLSHVHIGSRLTYLPWA